MVIRYLAEKTPKLVKYGLAAALALTLNSCKRPLSEEELKDLESRIKIYSVHQENILSKTQDKIQNKTPYDSILLDPNQFELKLVTAKTVSGEEAISFNNYINWAKENKAVALINASFWDTDKYPNGIIIEDNILKYNERMAIWKGKNIIKKRSNNLNYKDKKNLVHKGILLIKNNSVEIKDINSTTELLEQSLGTENENIKYAVQGYLYRLNNEDCLLQDKTTSAVRNAVGLNCNNKILILQSKTPIKIAVIKEKIKEYNCSDAIGLDGGGSTSLYYNQSQVEKASNRLLPNVLAVFYKR